MSSIVDIQNTLPLGYTIPPLISTSKSILRKSLIQIQPNNTGQYSYANNRMQFNVGNNTSFLIGPESYIRVEFWCSPNTPRVGSGSTFFSSNSAEPFQNLDTLCSLEIGGIHACFKSIRIAAISQGTTIQIADEYNRCQAILSVMSETDSKIDYESWRFGDSSNTGMVSQKPWKIIPLVAGARGTDAAGATGHFPAKTGDIVQIRTVLASAGANPTYSVMKFLPGVLAQLDPQPGDLLVLNMVFSANTDANPPTLPDQHDFSKTIVAPVLWANTSTLGLDDGAGVAVSLWSYDTLAFSHEFGLLEADRTSVVGAALAGRVMSGTLIKTYSRASARSLVCNGRKHVLEFRPKMSFFDIDSFPLFVLRNGIMIELELDAPQRALRFGTIHDVNSSFRSQPDDFWYFMENVYFYGKFSTPHPSVVSTYVELWNSDRGLNFPMPSYVVRTYTGSTGASDTIRVNMGVRSLRKVVAVVYDQNIAEGNGKSSQYNDALSTFFRSSISSYQFQVGAFMFPLQKVECPGTDITLVTNAAVSSVTGFKVFVPTVSTTAATTSGGIPNMQASSGGYLNSTKYHVPNESFEHALQTFPTDSESRFSLNQMQLVHSYSGLFTTTTAAAPYMPTIVNESGRFIMVADLSRDLGPGGQLTGTDVSIVPLQLNIERPTNNPYSAGGLSTPRVYIFGFHDGYLTLSSQGIFVLT